MLAREECALSNLLPFSIINQRTICEQNSTAIPTVITRLTSDTALALILAMTMTPPICTIIIKTTEMIMSAPHTSKPSIKTVTRNTAPA